MQVRRRGRLSDVGAACLADDTQRHGTVGVIQRPRYRHEPLPQHEGGSILRALADRSRQALTGVRVARRWATSAWITRDRS